MPRTRQQNEALRNKRKEQILNSALRVFCFYPAKDVSVSLIAREAKCVHSLIYHYFSNVNEIALEVIKYIHSYIADLFLFLEEPEVNPSIKMIGLISYFVDKVKTDPKYAYYLQALISLTHFVPKEENPYSHDIIMKKAVALVVEGQKQNKIKKLSPELVVAHVYLFCRGLISEVISDITEHSLRYTAAFVYLPLLTRDEGCNAAYI